MQVNPIVPVSPPQSADSPQADIQPEKTAANALGADPSAAVPLAARTLEPAPALRPTLQDRIDMTRCLLQLRV
jgi:hypothetical protein